MNCSAMAATLPIECIMSVPLWHANDNEYPCSLSRGDRLLY